MHENEDDGDAAFQAEMEHRLAFDARFPPNAFEPVVRALRVSPSDQNLKVIREWLMPYLEMYFSGKTGGKSSLTTRIAWMRRFRDAAAVMKTSLSKPGGYRWAPTIGLLDAVDDQFIATVERLWEAADPQVKALEAMSPRRGRPRKVALREFAPDLRWVYEKMTGSKATKPYWLPDSGVYGGEFYGFVVAVWECLRAYLPEFKHDLPETKVGLAQALQDDWPKGGSKEG